MENKKILTFFNLLHHIFPCLHYFLKVEKSFRFFLVPLPSLREFFWYPDIEEKGAK